jgi:undecaprenyl-phosphate galactose phosphotransferase/putative colanic acid biosynthesis UDP-glucose lipid carrier transferase
LLKYSEVSVCVCSIFISFFVLLFISRVVFMKLMKYIQTQGYNYKNVVILGQMIKENIRNFLPKT